MPVSGALELNGTSLPATFPLELRLASGQVAAAGRTTVNARAYGIEVPQAADFVVVDPQITLEISLVLLKP
jgi:polyisoprenoid-binding protein YceI